MVSHDDHLVSTLANGLSWLWFRASFIFILVIFLVFLDTTLRLVIGLNLGSSLVHVVVVRVLGWGGWSLRRALVPYKLVPVKARFTSIIEEENACWIREAISIKKICEILRWVEVSHRVIAEIFYPSAVWLLIYNLCIKGILIEEGAGLDIILNEDVVQIDSDSSIDESSLHCSI